MKFISKLSVKQILHDLTLRNNSSATQVQGWIKTVRKQKQNMFIELNDGSSLSNIQLILDLQNSQIQKLESQLTTGTSIAVQGKAQENWNHKNLNELVVSELQIIGPCDAKDYPLQKKKHTLEFLRDIAHLRPRSNTIASMLRIRNTAFMAIHEYYQKNGFFHIHTPILTSSDCEGAGEQFQVISNYTEKSDTQFVQKSQTEFFGKDVFLTVSGQLQAEIFATSLSKVYTFGPTFRAEMSKTNRHLAEFWMLEMEQAFADLSTIVSHGESLLKYCIEKVLQENREDVEFFEKFYEPNLLQKLSQHAELESFPVITYTEAIEHLLQSKENFQFPVEWGCNLQSEHEIYLCEKVFQGKPLFITNYPKQIKPFYAKQDSNCANSKETVSAVDMIVPKIGELIGGSVREDHYETLKEAMIEKNIKNLSDYEWYLDLRKFGSVPHAGFGLGFERLILYLTGLENIRDAIPIPRATHQCKF